MTRRRKTDGERIILALRKDGWMRLWLPAGAAYIDRLIRKRMADAWDEGYQDHQAMIEGIARKPSNPYR